MASGHKRRARRRTRPLRLAVTLASLLAIAAAAVVVALNRLDDGNPVAQRCTAEVNGQAWYFSPAQADNAALIVAASVRRGMPARAATIALATALQESKLININYGDRDSLGLFQQRPSQGWGTQEQVMDPVYSTKAFYDALEKVPAYETMEITDAAQAVQRSAFPHAYAQHELRSRAWASALTGHSFAAVTCELAPLTQTADQAANQALRDRLAEDLAVNVTAAQNPSQLDVNVTSLVPGDTDRATWAAAQWAVAVSATLNIDAVEAGGQRWSREDPVWRPAADKPATGTIRIYLGKQQ